MIQTIRGVTAHLQWGYYCAGALGAWTVEKTDSGRTLSASILEVDTFKASQRPLTFVANHAKGVWRWPILTLEMTGATLTATLGPKER